jgi:DNA-binding response OmpR family regulator
MRELLARASRLLRRTQRASPARGEQRRLRFGNWTLDTSSRELLLPARRRHCLAYPVSRSLSLFSSTLSSHFPANTYRAS